LDFQSKARISSRLSDKEKRFGSLGKIHGILMIKGQFSGRFQPCGHFRNAVSSTMDTSPVDFNTQAYLCS